MNSKNPGEGLKILFEAIGVIILVVGAFIIMIIFLPLAILSRFQMHWERAKKKEEKYLRDHARHCDLWNCNKTHL